MEATDLYSFEEEMEPEQVRRTVCETLFKHILSFGIPIQMLTQITNYSEELLIKWFTGQELPDRAALIVLARVLEVEDGLESYLFKLSGYEVITDSERRTIDKLIIRTLKSTTIQTTTVSGIVAQNGFSSPIEAAHEMRHQIGQLSNAVERISKRIEETGSLFSNDVPNTITRELNNIKSTIGDIKVTSKELTAPVRIPTQDNLEVRLLPSHILERLEEYRSEESTWFSWFGVFLGVVLGVIINLITGSTISDQGIILTITFTIIAFLFLYFAIRARQRGDQLRNKLLSQPPKNDVESAG